MGTNYYLHRPPEVCPTCERPLAEATVHIGKASYGWVFLWRGYRSDDPTLGGRELATPEQWWEFLAEQVAAGAVIKDEYGDEMPLDELVELVEDRAKPLRDGLPPRRHVPLSPEDTVAAGTSDVAFFEFL